MTQTCYKCKEIKNLDEFYKRKVNKNGYCGRCKKCDNILKNDWVKRNPEKRRAYERKRTPRMAKKKINDRIRNRKYRKELSDQYICYLIRVSSKNLIAEDIPNELIEAYRLNLQLKRALNLTPKLRGEEDKP